MSKARHSSSSDSAVMEGNPTGAMGLADYLGWNWKSKADLCLLRLREWGRSRGRRKARIAQVWHEMTDAYYPDTAWLCPQRDAFERLNALRSQNGIPTFEHALQRVFP
jgi:Family of unknown function (DUF6084)